MFKSEYREFYDHESGAINEYLRLLESSYKGWKLVNQSMTATQVNNIDSRIMILTSFEKEDK